LVIAVPDSEPLLFGEPAFRALLVLVDPWLEGRPDAAKERLGRLEPIDWGEVHAYARRHRVVPYAARGLESLTGEITVPPDVTEQFRQGAQAATFHELAMMAALRLVKTLFDDAEIPFLVIKGLVLSSEYHGRMGLRVNHDIDIVVDPSDMMPADALLSSAGWVRIEPNAALNEQELADWIKRTKDWVYVDPSGRIILELHHRLFDNMRLCEPGIMQRSRPVELFGQVKVRTLGPEDLPGYLALHGALHAWSRVKWLVDMGMALRAAGPDAVSAFIAQHRGRPSSRALRQAVSLCRELFAAGEGLPVLRQSWSDRLLASVARQAMAGARTSELEDTRFGTTLKNVSHYFLWLRPGYLISEIGYDMTDMSRENPQSDSALPIWMQRAASWLSRHR
jgi:hypothetical protein